MACRCGKPPACVRKITFTNWINECLRIMKIRVKDLEEDLSDGLVLLKLLETLAPQKKMPGRYYASPSTQVQRTQNIALVFRFLTEVEKLQLERRSPGDILDKNFPNVLELLWVLILHYHIIGAPINPTQRSMATFAQRKIRSKHYMLIWVNAILPKKGITNFTTDWNDGVNLAALVNFCKPGLIDSSMYNDNPFERILVAMKVAQEKLKVPQVLQPEDLFAEQPDELAVMTYLSYFCRNGSPGEKVLLAWIQKKIPEDNITNLSTNWMNGISLGALVNSLSQQAFPQYKKMNPTSRVSNCKESMKQAQTLFNIRPLVPAEDFSSSDLEYLIRVAYLIQFYGEPVSLKADISKVHVSPMKVGVEEGHLVVSVDLDCSCAGKALVGATVSTKDGKAVETSTTEYKLDHYSIKFTCEDGVEMYSLKILYGENEVSGSPFIVNLADADATKVQHTGTNVPSEKNQKVVLAFNTKEAGFGKLAVMATGKSAGQVPTEIVRKPEGAYDVIFIPPIPDEYSIDVKWGKFLAMAKGQTCGAIPVEFLDSAQKDYKLLFEPPTPDLYTVDISWGGTPVPGSPFMVNLLPVAMPEKVEVGDPIYGGVGKNVDFLVDITYAGSGKLTSLCKGERVGDVATSILALSKKAYQVSFVPFEVDIYYLSIFFEGVPIQGSPFQINMLQKQRTTEIPQPKHTKEIGVATIIRVKQVKVTATCFGDTTGPCNVVVKKDSDGYQKVIVNPKLPDIYTLEVFSNESPIPNSPFIISYLPYVVADHTKCEILDIDKLLSSSFIDLESIIKFSVDTRKAGESTLEVRVEAPDKKRYDVDIKPREDESQIFDISYSPKVAGTHYLKMIWNGKPITSSPLPIPVVDASNMQHFTPGKAVSLDFKVPIDVKEKDIVIRAVHTISGNIAKTTCYLSKGKYRVSFNPKLFGLYCLHILIKDIELPSSPIVIRYGDAPQPDNCIVKELLSQAFLNTEVRFTIDCTNCGSGELRVKGSHSKLGKEDKSQVTWIEISENIYAVTFIPSNVGEYSLLITWAGKLIQGTPHRITVIEVPPEAKPPTAELFTVDLMSTTPNKREKVTPIPDVVTCIVGQALILTVTVPLITGTKRELLAIALGEQTGETDIKVQSVSKNVYNVVFAPQEPDQYSITVKYGDKNVLTTPIAAVFTRAPTDPGQVEIVKMNEWEMPLQYFIHQEFKCMISTFEAGPGILEVNAKGPDKEKESVVSIKKVDHNRYSIRYTPQVTGAHYLHLLWDKTTIPSSPLTIQVNEPPVVSKGHPGIFEIVAGKWKLKDIISMGVHLDTGTEYKVSRTQKNGKYIFGLQPSEPGYYEISLTVSGEEITRPFRFKFDQPSLPDKVIILGFNSNEERKINQKMHFTVDVADAGIGTLEVIVEGPGKTELKTLDNKDGTYTISFSAFSSGRYSIKITWGGEEIPGSPYEIIVASKRGERTLGWNKGSSDAGDKVSEPECSKELSDYLESDYFSGILGYFGWGSGNDESYTPSHDQSSSSFPEESTETSQQKRSAIEKMQIGRACHWKIDTTGVKGNFDVTAVGKTVGNVDVRITQEDKEIYQVIFSPTKPDQYTISITVNGVHLPNSPVIVNYKFSESNPEYVKTFGIDEISSLLAVGQKVRVVVDTREAGIGEFKVETKTPPSKKKTNSLEIENLNEDPGLYDVMYTPYVVGIHSLTLLFGNQPIAGSPVKLVVCDPQLVSYNKTTFSTVKVGEKVIFQCDVSQAGTNEVTASCVGANAGKILTSITKGEGNKINITFQPNIKDLYTLEVKLGPYHIKGSPFTLNLSSIQIEKLLINGPIQPEGSQGPVRITFNASDLPRGKVASICKYKSKTASVIVKETAQDEYLLQFKPPEPAQYFWSITYNGQQIPGSPFLIDTSPYSEKTNVLVPSSGSIGQYVYYEINVTKAGMGKLTAICKGKQGKRIPVEITQIRQGVFSISFLPLAFDIYSLYVQWSGNELPNSPFVFDLSQISGDTPTNPVNFPLPLPPITDTSAIEISCNGEEYGTIPTKLTAVSTTKYHVSFQPQGPDLYTLSVTFNGKHIKGSPYVIDLRVLDNIPTDETDNESIKIPVGDKEDDSMPPSDQDLEELQRFIGSEFVVRVQPFTPDGRIGELKATATGSTIGKTKIEIEKLSDNYFAVIFAPTEPDVYTVSITMNGEHISHSPFEVKFQKPPAQPSKIEVVGLQDMPSFLEVHKEVTLVVNGTEAGTGILRAEVKGPNDSEYKPTLEVKPRSDEQGIYDLVFIASIGGTYSLSIFWGEELIPGYPLQLHVVDLSISKKFSFGTEVTTDELQISSSPLNIKAYAVLQYSTSQINVKINEIRKQYYKFSFKSKKSGFYFIHILVSGEELPLSPIPVYISKPVDAEKCVIQKVMSMVFVNDQVTMIVDCSEGGDGILEAKLEGPDGVHKLLGIINNEDGTYTITYSCSAAGMYLLYLTWSGYEIPKSPLSIEVRQRKQDELPVDDISIADCTGEGNVPSIFGQEEMSFPTYDLFSFNLRLTEEQFKNIRAKAIGENESLFDFDIIKIMDGLFKFSFRPPFPGKYFLDFRLGDSRLKLPQLPKRLVYTKPIVDATKVKALKHTIPGLLQMNRKVFFQIDCRLAGEGSIDFKFEGPSVDETDFHVEPTPDKPEFYDIWFTPTVSGVYKLILLWDNITIPGFPLVFNVVSIETPYGKPFSQDIAVSGSAKEISCYAVHTQNEEKFKIKYTQIRKGWFRFQFSPKKPGTYNLYIFVGGENIAGSPFRVNCGLPALPWNITVKELEGIKKTNSPVKFKINASKAGSGVLNVKLFSMNTTDVPKVTLEEKGGGVYMAEFTPKVEGQYNIQITWSGEEIPNSPFLVTAKKDYKGSISNEILGGIIFDDEQETLPKPIIHEADLHIFGRSLNFGKISFKIKHSGASGSLDIRYRGPKEGLITKVVKGLKADTCEITPKIGGKYVMSFYWNGQVIYGGPYILLFMNPRAITGFNLQGQSFQVGQSYYFTLNTSDLTSGKLEVYSEPENAVEIYMEASSDVTTYKYIFTPKQVGDFKIHVLYNGTEIQGSPFLVHFIEAATSTLNFNLYANGIETGDISAVLKSAATQEAVPISLNQLFGGECNLEFMPTEGNEYILTLTCNLKVKKEQISGSPFGLTYTAARKSASMCLIEGDGLAMANTLGQWRKFVMNCENAGPGTLTAKIEGDGAEVKVVKLSEFKYEVQYCIHVEGRYALIIKWGEENIFGSPFEILTMAKSFITEESTAETWKKSSSSSIQVSIKNFSSEVKVKEPIKFDMEWQGDLGDRKLDIVADTDSGAKVNGNLVPAGENAYNIIIPTNVAGIYSINVLCQNRPLLPQPIVVKVSA